MINPHNVVNKFISSTSNDDKNYEDSLTAVLKCLDSGDWSIDQLFGNIIDDIEKIDNMRESINFINRNNTG